MTSRAERPLKPHGTLSRYTDGKCRCPKCREAGTAYEADRRRKIAYGIHRPFVDAEPVRRHVRALMAAGIGWERVAFLAGVSTGMVGRLLYGERGSDPSKRVRPSNADKLLSVQPVRGNVAHWVDATGARRRLQALAVAGWSMLTLASHTRLTQATLCDVSSGRRDRVLAATDRAVADLFRTFWNRQPPRVTSSQRRVVLVTSRRAAGLGWMPALAWDDIDDPAERPSGVRRRAAS